MTALSRFALLLGLPAHQAEDALHSERAAPPVLTRRSFFAASGAMVAGTAFSFGKPRYGQLGYDPTGAHSPTGPIGITGPTGATGSTGPTGGCRISGRQYTWANIEVRIDQKLVLPVTEIQWT